MTRFALALAAFVLLSSSAFAQTERDTALAKLNQAEARYFSAVMSIQDYGDTLWRARQYLDAAWKLFNGSDQSGFPQNHLGYRNVWFLPTPASPRYMSPDARYRIAPLERAELFISLTGY